MFDLCHFVVGLQIRIEQHRLFIYKRLNNIVELRKLELFQTKITVTSRFEMADLNSSDNCQRTSDLKYLIRVKTEIPVIKLGYEYFTRFIDGLKESSTVVQWSLNKATSGMDQVVCKYSLPYVIRDQLLAVDRLLCTSLDLTELNLPILTKTPNQVYEESVEYVLGIVSPITDWVDVELLPPAEYYIDRYLPELYADQKIIQMNDKENGSKACHLAIKLARRVKQHAYAEPKYLGDLMYYGYEESILLMKILLFDPKLLSKTLHQTWKKLGDGVTPDEAANSLLLVEMGHIKLRKCASLIVQVIEITAEMVKCYIEIFLRYVNSAKNCIIDNLSRVVNPSTKKQIKTMETQSTIYKNEFNTETKTKRHDNTSNENQPSTTLKFQ